MSKVRKGIVLLVTAATMAVVPAAMQASGASEAGRKGTPTTSPYSGGGTTGDSYRGGGYTTQARGATWQ